jgi:hypothetical protein
MLYNDQAYKDFMDDAAKDDRVGKHDAIVSKVVADTWESGDPRHKITFNLLSAGNSKADLTWSPPPPIEELMKLKEDKSQESRGKKKAIANAIAIAQQAAQHYSKSVPDFREGDRVRVQTVKTKVDKDTNTGGFIRVIALLPLGAENGGAPASSGPGF